jgi:hypothetical protein
VAEELGVYLADRPHGPGDLVFTAPHGGPVRSSKFVPVRVKPAIAAANQAIAELDPDSRPDLPPEELRLYDRRHTAASPMIRQGAQRQGGAEAARPRHGQHHPDTYGNLFPDELDALADRLEAPAPMPWQLWHGPGTDHRLCRWTSRRSAGWLRVSEGRLNHYAPPGFTTFLVV